MNDHRSATLGRVFTFTAILLLAALMLWIRLLPQDLVAADQWAEASARAQVDAQIDPRLPPAQREAVLQALLNDNRQVVDEVRADLRRLFHQDVSFATPDGKRHLFLGGDDDYYFLRQARNILQHGSACPSVVNGQCLDHLVDAPLGRVMEKPFSPHPYAIAGLHRLLTPFWPDLPLMVTAELLPTLMMLLAVPLVFLSLQRLIMRHQGGGSLTAGFAAMLGTAAILLCLPVLGRSLGGDNDVWVVLLPLFTLFLLSFALDRATPAGQVAAALGAGGLLGLLAAGWGGWHLFAAIFLSGLIGLLAWSVIARLASGQSQYLTARSGRALAALVLGLLAVATLLQAGIDWGETLTDITNALGLGARSVVLDNAPDPNPFAFVGELQNVPIRQMVHYFGPLAFILGVIGPLLALTPERGRPYRRLAIAAVLALIVAVVMYAGLGQGYRLLALMVAVTSCALLLWRAFANAAPPAFALFGAIWLFVGLMLSQDGQRYILLLGPPLGLGVAMSFAALMKDTEGAIGASLRRGYKAAVLGAASLGAGLALLLPLLAPSINEAKFQVPRLNAAWAGVLDHIRQDSAPDAIITTWWDYGHWASFLAERKVTLDGASLRYRSIHWVGRALAAPDPAEAAGMLRILACGGSPEGQRPFEALVAAGVDRADAFTIVTSAARDDEAASKARLARTALSPDRQEAILHSLHCQPPEHLLVTTNKLLETPAWAVSGLWNPELAWLNEAVLRGNEVLLEQIAARLSLPGPQFETLLAQAREADSDFAKAVFAAPDAVIWSTGWHDCTFLDERKMTCPLGLRSAEGIHLRSLTFDLATPQDMVFDARAGNGQPLGLRPGLIRLALRDRLLDFAPEADGANVAVVVDGEAGRVFVASPGIARSFLVRLVLFDGRYDGDWVEKVAQGRTETGEVVTAWRMRSPSLPDESEK
ncbi:STT3 domain-containing protein [Telmatospirillum sp. J64-1]|uniref:STT3 domain-containing protein n=1 Tax=Telmatospirillum sp. J64-1 TaxID=2502183 RepID=UPI00115E6877|nr:STT3 domain-containing protein [Telmatospirillum sp. J64-1]